MIKPKLKTCVECGKETYIFSKGRCKSCATKSGKKPRNVSLKQQNRNNEYSKVRKEYLNNLPSNTCKVCNKREITDIHHMVGRLGDYLINTKYFLPVCRECHNRIEDNPDWAYENNYSIKRNHKHD